MGSEVKYDMSGQFGHGLRVCNVKVRILCLLGAARAHFLEFSDINV